MQCQLACVNGVRHWRCVSMGVDTGATRADVVRLLKYTSKHPFNCHSINGDSDKAPLSYGWFLQDERKKQP